MTNGNGKTKMLSTVLGAVLIATITAAGGMMYRHEVALLTADKEISKLRARVYRERLRDYEFEERFSRSKIQLINLRQNKEGGLSIVDQTRKDFYMHQLELIKEEKENYVETWKHEGQ